MADIITRILTVSAEAGVLILAILLLRKLFNRRLHPFAQYGLWLLPALRLLLPFSFQSALSLRNLPPFAAHSAALQPGAGFNGGTASALEPLATLPPASAPVTVEPAPAAHPLAPSPSAGAGTDWLTVLFWVWLAGFMLALAYMIIVNARFYRAARLTQARVSCPSPLPVYRVKRLGSPCLCGCFRPAVLVNDAALCNEETLALVLRHELCHHRAGDAWWALLRNLCCAAHWFNPLVWWAAVCSRADCELACDARVMQGFSQQERERYGMALLSIIRTGMQAGGRSAGLATATTSMTGNKKELRERVARIGKKPRALAALTLIVALCVGLVALAACSNGRPAAKVGDAKALFAAKTASVNSPLAVGKLVSLLEAPEGLEDAFGRYRTAAGQGSLSVTLPAGEEALSLLDNGNGSEAFAKNALVLFSLIDDMRQLQFTVESEERAIAYQYSRDWADYWAGGNALKYGESAEALSKLLELDMGPVASAKSLFIASKLARGQTVSGRAYPMSAEDLALCDTVINSTLQRSAAWPGVDVGALEECYCLTKINNAIDGAKEQYYFFLLDGTPVIQFGGQNLYMSISEAHYNAIAALLGEGALASPVPGADSTPPAPMFDRTTPEGAAEEFLTRYFDDLCIGNTDWGWDDATKTEYDGLVQGDSPLYNESICILKQWIDHCAFLAETGYDVEGDRGRFASLEILSFGLLDTLAPGADYLLSGYFKTTAFGTLVDIGMTKSETGEYMVASADFPDSKEFMSFRDAFLAYMGEKGLTDYRKSAYIDHERAERDAIIAERDAWKTAERAEPPFSLHRSAILLEAYGIALNSNGAMPREELNSALPVQEAQGGLGYYARTGEQSALMLKILPGINSTPAPADDLVEYALNNANLPMQDGGQSNAAHYDIAYHDPASFFGGKTPVTRMASVLLRAVGGKDFAPVERVYTAYFVELEHNGERTLLTFLFFNAYQSMAEENHGQWYLVQSAADCESWMKTLAFSG